MKTTLKKLALGIASAGLLTLYGCGGGGSGNTPPANPPITSATSDIAITVIDGPIRNALVCLDKNANGVCDATEPTGRTDATGKTTLKVDSADVGKFAVLAVVGSDAVDMDRPNTLITTPFTMTAPADKPAVISPLTTLVQTLVQNAGLSSTAAEAQLKEQTGLTVSLFEDFTASKTAANETAGTLARMLVVTTQQKLATITSSIGTTAIDGSTIKASDIDKLVQARLIEILSNVLTALGNPTIAAAATPADKEIAIQAQSAVLLAAPNNATTAASVATLVGIANATATTTTAVVTAPVAGFSLGTLNFLDTTNWFVRVLTGSAAQNTPDAAGNFKNVDRRAISVTSLLGTAVSAGTSASPPPAPGPGTVVGSNTAVGSSTVVSPITLAGQIATWNTGSEPRRQSDLSFNGTTWVNCPLNFENTSTPRDATGNSNYSYCNRETGTSNRASFDVSGKTMASVYQQVRDAGYTNLTIANAVAALGSDVFPAGSTLRYQTNIPLSTANTYYPGTGNIVNQYSTAISNGGLASSQAPGVACNASEFNFAATTPSASLEAMVASMTGTPCLFNPVFSFVYNGTTYTNPDPTTESWNNSTLSIGTIGTAPVGTGVAPGFYTGNQLIRLAFKGTGTNPVTYYSCKQRFNNGTTRNCSVIGTGNYTISNQGDARVLTLNNPPAAIAPLGYQRVFVERGGKVFFGYKNNLSVTTSARLNTTAAAALFVKLGLPAVNPDVPLALTRTSYAGDWNFTNVQNPSAGSDLLRISSNGTTSCVSTNNTVTPPQVTLLACVITFTNLATGAFTGFTPGNTGNVTGVLDFLTGAATATAVDGTRTETLVGARR